MSTRSRPRPRWTDLPGRIRGAVEDALGSAVVGSESRPGGWSPGSADLLALADGRRVFVKTADPAVNARTVAMHRREAEVLRLLGGAPAPRLLAEVSASGWVALVVEAIDGRHPDPGSVADTAAVLDAVAALPDVPEGADLARLEDELAADALGWRRLREDDAAPPAVAPHLCLLEPLAERWAEALHGDSVVHLDLRVDNALVDDAGRGRLIDWPSAVRGAPWIDAVTYLLDVRHLGGSVDAGMRHPVLRDVPPDLVDVWLSVLGAYFFDSARRAESPGLPGLRAYQAAQGETALSWLLERRPGY